MSDQSFVDELLAPEEQGTPDPSDTVVTDAPPTPSADGDPPPAGGAAEAAAKPNGPSAPDPKPADKGEGGDAPPEQPDGEEPVKVPLHYLKEERAKRQSTDQELQRLRDENARLQRQQQTRQVLQQNEADELAELERLKAEDEALTGKQIDRLVELRMTERQRLAEQQQQAERQRIVTDAHQLALETLTADKLGEGLDYESVWRAGYDNLSRKDHADILAAGEDAPARMYDRCIARTPELRERQAKAPGSGAAGSGAAGSGAAPQPDGGAGGSNDKATNTNGSSPKPGGAKAPAPNGNQPPSGSDNTDPPTLGEMLDNTPDDVTEYLLSEDEAD